MAVTKPTFVQNHARPLHRLQYLGPIAVTLQGVIRSQYDIIL